jgi:hypothetical protein
MAATIFNTDTLPCADFDASPAYTSDALGTRAVSSLSFNLVTKDYEQVIGFSPKNEKIELHTERGLCVVNCNILNNHSERNKVERTENTVDDFPLTGAVTLTFNRALDVAAMQADTAWMSKFIGIKEGAAAVASTLSFSTDNKTVTIKPNDSLKTSTNYYVWLKNVPGLGIAGAGAINDDAGSCSGRASSYGLLDKAFQTK